MTRPPLAQSSSRSVRAQCLAVAIATACLFLGAPGCASHNAAAHSDDPKAPADARASRAAPGAPDSAAPGKSQFESAATDLQSLFDDMKNQPAPPAGSAPSARAGNAGSPSKPAANSTIALDPIVALDDLKDEPAPHTPATSPSPAALTLNAAPALQSDPLVQDRPGGPAYVRGEPLSSLRIGTVALCQRVESFGRFTPLPSNRFIAGRSALMILYSEVVNFTQREEPISESVSETQQVVELGQALDLLYDVDGSRQFAVAEQPVRDASRTPRKDFFIVQRLELPRNLSVGKYNLKLTVRDRLGGAEAEKIVPIVIVADPSAEAARALATSPDLAPMREPARPPTRPAPAPKRQY